MKKRRAWLNIFTPEDTDALESERMARFDAESQRQDSPDGNAPDGEGARDVHSYKENESDNKATKGTSDGRARRIMEKIREYRKIRHSKRVARRETKKAAKARRRAEYRAMTPAQRQKIRRRKWKIIGFSALGAFGVLVIALILVMDFGSWVWLDESKLTSLRQTTLMYDAHDVEVAGLYSGENRITIDIGTLPDYVKQAFVSAEDARFYSHHGIDVWRIGGAIISNLKSGGYSQGASTISQQLIKLTHLSAEKKLARKANEAVLAMVLESRYSKDEILGMYMNTVYFGHGAYGIEAAARAYFSKSAAELDVAESALMAAVIKSPSGFAPHIKPERALTRRNWVLGEMLRLEYINQAEYDAALAEPISLNESFAQMPDYGWYIDYALSEAEAKLGLTPDELLAGGYKIYTALDTDIQGQAQNVFAEAEFPADAADGTQCQAALSVVSNDDGAILALIGGRDYTVRRGLNRATDVKRQPGSAIKPLAVYAPAIDRFGYLPSSFLNDTPTDFGGWSPRNAGDKYRGIVTLRKTASSSINVATVDLLNRIGVKAGIEYLNSVGIATDVRDEYLPLALGAMTYGTSPLDLCGAYCAFASGGNYEESYSVRYIMDSSGQPIYVHDGTPKRVMSEQSAYIMTSMLQSVVKQGTAGKLNALGINIAAKTGTAALSEKETGIAGNRDIWLCAYTPRISMAVWMGFDRTDSKHYMPESASGSNQPTKLALELLKSDVMDEYVTGAFKRPSGVREVLIDGWALENLHAVLLAGEDTPSDQLSREVFTSRGLPTTVSTVFSEPLPVYDLTGGYDATDVPYIEFTCPQQYVQYNVYRTLGGERTLVGMLSGEEGQKLAYSDVAAIGERNLTYEVSAYSQALEKEGMSASIVLERSIWDEFGRFFGGGAQPAPEISPAPYTTSEPIYTAMPEITPAPENEPLPQATVNYEYSTAAPQQGQDIGVANDGEKEVSIFAVG